MNQVKYVLLSLLLLFSYHIHGQYQIGLIPRESPNKSISQKVGYTDIKIDYGSPKVKGRKIWGELEPYQEVWRSGANEATTIDVSTDIYVSDKKLPKGKYAIFIVPREKGQPWTMNFNTRHKQWGAFNYDATLDTLSVEVTPRWGQSHEEELTYTILQDGYDEGTLRLSWERVVLDVPFKTDYLDLFVKEVEERALKANTYTQWVVYIQGADYLIDNYPNQTVISSWLEKGADQNDEDGEWSNQYYPRNYIIGHHRWASAKYQAYLQNFENAIELAESITLLEGKYNFYKRNKDRLEIDKLIDEWREEAP